MAEILAVRLRTSDLPSAALPASGSRGSSTTSQPSGSPALSREATTTKIEVNRVKELLAIRCWLFVRRSRPSRPPLQKTSCLSRPSW